MPYYMEFGTLGPKPLIFSYTIGTISSLNFGWKTIKKQAWIQQTDWTGDKNMEKSQNPSKSLPEGWIEKTIKEKDWNWETKIKEFFFLLLISQVI